MFDFAKNGTIPEPVMRKILTRKFAQEVGRMPFVTCQHLYFTCHMLHVILYMTHVTCPILDFISFLCHISHVTFYLSSFVFLRNPVTFHNSQSISQLPIVTIHNFIFCHSPVTSQLWQSGQSTSKPPKAINSSVTFILSHLTSVTFPCHIHPLTFHLSHLICHLSLVTSNMSPYRVTYDRRTQ